MITTYTDLLKRIDQYVDAYILCLGACSGEQVEQVNDDLRRVIDELQNLQKHPDQRGAVDAVSEQIAARGVQLRALIQPPSPGRSAQATESLRRALHRYLGAVVVYLEQAGGFVGREHMSLLLGEMIADLRALALHPADEDVMRFAADLETKCEQLPQLQRPWQQFYEQAL
ncbi:MAG TPA: hypothetical protein VFZ66_13200 [Herpetosiphonaceae bacterium]